MEIDRQIFDYAYLNKFKNYEIYYPYANIERFYPFRNSLHE
jgi:hypothetical protein